MLNPGRRRRSGRPRAAHPVLSRVPRGMRPDRPRKEPRRFSRAAAGVAAAALLAGVLAWWGMRPATASRLEQVVPADAVGVVWSPSAERLERAFDRTRAGAYGETPAGATLMAGWLDGQKGVVARRLVALCLAAEAREVFAAWVPLAEGGHALAAGGLIGGALAPEIAMEALADDLVGDDVGLGVERLPGGVAVTLRDGARLEVTAHRGWLLAGTDSAVIAALRARVDEPGAPGAWDGLRDKAGLMGWAVSGRLVAGPEDDAAGWIRGSVREEEGAWKETWRWEPAPPVASASPPDAGFPAAALLAWTDLGFPARIQLPAALTHLLPAALRRGLADDDGGMRPWPAVNAGCMLPPLGEGGAPRVVLGFSFAGNDEAAAVLERLVSATDGLAQLSEEAGATVYEIYGDGPGAPMKGAFAVRGGWAWLGDAAAVREVLTSPGAAEVAEVFTFHASAPGGDEPRPMVFDARVRAGDGVLEGGGVGPVPPSLVLARLFFQAARGYTAPP